MTMAREALEGSNNVGKIRAALAGTYALQVQTMTARTRQAYKAPAIGRCVVCGQPVSVRRRPPVGQAVYCRSGSRCRVRAFRARQRAQRDQAQEIVTETPAQMPEARPGRAQETAPDQPKRPRPEAPLWLAIRTG